MNLPENGKFNVHSIGLQPTQVVLWMNDSQFSKKLNPPYTIQSAATYTVKNYKAI